MLDNYVCGLKLTKLQQNTSKKKGHLKTKTPTIISQQIRI